MKYDKYTVEELIKMRWLEKPMDGNHGSKHPTNNDYVSKGIPFVMVSDIVNGKIDYNSCKYISPEQRSKLDKGFAKPGDVLLSHKATIGVTCIVDKKYDEIVLTPQLTYYRVIKNINNYYLKYYFDSPYFQTIFSNWAKSGSTRSYLGITAQLKLPILLPKIEIQNKIATILSNIDSKIELNNEMNSNLLKLCKYKYDVFNKNNDDWNLIKINDLNLEVTDYVANGSFKSLADNVTLYDKKEYALYVRNTDLKVNFTGKRKYVDKKSYEFLTKSKLKGGELIISNVGDVGSVYICPHLDMPMTLGSNVIMLYSKDTHYYNYFLYFFFTSVYGQHMIKGITGGSAQPKFNKTDFRNMLIKIPPLEELDKFNTEINSLYKRYELNVKENEKLSELRDTLLPMLMSGEIDLDDIEI